MMRHKFAQPNYRSKSVLVVFKPNHMPSSIDRIGRHLIAWLQDNAIRIILVLIVIAACMRTYHLGGPSRDYDEGVYWQTLNAIKDGYRLYDQVFFSQPPFFIEVVYPFSYLSRSINAARIGVAAVSLLGLVGAYMTGKALTGRVGGVAAVAILAFSVTYLEESQRLQAEAPATAFLFLSVGAAFLWANEPRSRKGLSCLIACGATAAMGILVKLFDVLALAPVILIISGAAWRMPLAASQRIAAFIFFLAVILTVFLLVTSLFTFPYFGFIPAFLTQVVAFHLAARAVFHSSPHGNLLLLRHFFSQNAMLCFAAAYGTVAGLLRRKNNLLPLVIWLVITLIFLLFQSPLFPHHAIALIPPLISLAVLGFDGIPLGENLPETNAAAFQAGRHAIMLCGLVTAVVLSSLREDYHYYQGLMASSEIKRNSEEALIASDVRRFTPSGKTIITDAQFVAARASRDTPPWLVDTSAVRIESGFLNVPELIDEGSRPTVSTILFSSGRLSANKLAGFHLWVKEHFYLVRSYKAGAELWTRVRPG
jgi:hypothetical protein